MLDLKAGLFPLNRYVNVPTELVRDGKLWVPSGRYQLVRKVSPGRLLIRLGEHELTIIRDGEGWVET